MAINPLIPIGTKIQVDKSKIENLISNTILDESPQLINGEVIDYKMTDGMGIGYVLITDNNQKIWIFNSELNDQTKREHKIDIADTNTTIINKELIEAIDKVKYDIDGNKKIQTIANPINIFSWLIYTLKDIF